MVRLKIKDVAAERGISLSSLQLAAKLPMSTARRYFYGSATGMRKDANTLRQVHLDTLGTIAHVLGVSPGELITEGDA